MIYGEKDLNPFDEDVPVMRLKVANSTVRRLRPAECHARDRYRPRPDERSSCAINVTSASVANLPIASQPLIFSLAFEPS